jgi:hypothetical protein
MASAIEPTDDITSALRKLAADFARFKVEQEEKAKTQHDETLAAIAAVSTRVDTLQASVGALQAASANQQVRFINSLKGNGDPLQPFPFDCFGRPWPADVEQPATLLDLAVAGTKMKPGRTEKSTWTSVKSKAFLETAVDGYATTDGEGADTDDDDHENGNEARARRIKVILVVGGDVASVFATQHQFT